MSFSESILFIIYMRDKSLSRGKLQWVPWPVIGPWEGGNSLVGYSGVQINLM
jgi:hypothetical protein